MKMKVIINHLEDISALTCLDCTDERFVHDLFSDFGALEDGRLIYHEQYDVYYSDRDVINWLGYVAENYQAGLKIAYEGEELTLVDDAVYTGRELPKCWYTNHNDASVGEEYNYEVSVKAVDEQGYEAIVYWVLTGIKGDECELKNIDLLDQDLIVSR